MAVYTHLTEADITQHLTQYDLGDLVAWHGIAQGVSNSNFYVETSQERFILTLFEARTDAKDLPYFTAMMQHLARAGIACPTPIASRAGELILPLKGRASLMVSFLEGAGVECITNEHMPHLGRLLARMHMAFDGFTMQRENGMSRKAWQRMATGVMPRADEIMPGLGALITKELDFLENHWPSGLPAGVIHADVFPDNVFFQHGPHGLELSGIIDFYFACNDFYMYDLAITINAWCFDEANDFAYLPERTTLLLDAYQTIRPLSAAEQTALPILARGAAMRFLLTRSENMLKQEPDALVTAKDPMEYVKKLRFHQGDAVL